MSKVPINKNSWAVPINEFDKEKFKARYKLTDEDFEATAIINGAVYVRLFSQIKLEDEVPIFDPPDPIIVIPAKSAKEYADDIALMLFPGKDQDVERADLSAAFIGIINAKE